MNRPGTMSPTSADASPPAHTTTSSGGNGSVAGTVSDASATVDGPIKRVSNAARPAVDRFATGAHQAVDTIADAASTAAESLAVRTEQLERVHARMTEGCRVYVRANPLTAVGVALAAGFILSRLFRSR